MDISTNSNEVALIVSFAFFVAGVVKGVIGIGLPTTAITIMTFFVSPLMALGLNLIPPYSTAKCLQRSLVLD